MTTPRSMKLQRSFMSAGSPFSVPSPSCTTDAMCAAKVAGEAESGVLQLVIFFTNWSGVRF
jgi:hypothetical protein